jgi:hypothetical protein
MINFNLNSIQFTSNTFNNWLIILFFFSYFLCSLNHLFLNDDEMLVKKKNKYINYTIIYIELDFIYYRHSDDDKVI